MGGWGVIIDIVVYIYMSKCKLYVYNVNGVLEAIKNVELERENAQLPDEESFFLQRADL